MCIRDRSVEVIPLEEEYSFEAFGNLIRNHPQQIMVILEEIRRVHDETLENLLSHSPDEASFKSMVHKVKGGAQLLQAKNFIQRCEQLELEGPLPARLKRFQELLEEQNQVLENYKQRYRPLT